MQHLLDETLTIERKRVKHARITIGHDSRVRIVIPIRYTQAALSLLLLEKRSWIEKHLALARSDKESYLELLPSEIPFLGKSYRISTESISLTEIESWYKKRAREYFSRRIAELASTFGYRYNKLILRGSKTRWGTCSAKKNISINWRLMKAPAEVIDYVLLHELAHTLFFDHSVRFWGRLAETCPDFREQKTWLKKYGKFLY